MKKLSLLAFLFLTLTVSPSAASGQWENKGDYFFLAKTQENFPATGAGSNSFASRFLSYEGVDFLVKAPDDRRDYGRIDLTGNKIFSIPIPAGSRIEELHLLAGGGYGNSYKDDPILKLYGENYYYSTITATFAYEDGSFQSLSVPVFWDWFHLGTREWARSGARIKGLGDNPVRPKCSMYHITFDNPAPGKALRSILISDSWLENFPFSDIFAVTVKSQDKF